MSEQGDRSWKARPKLKAVTKCGCYYCCRTYNPKLIKEWVDNSQTAICPKCGIDSVVPYDSVLYGSREQFRQKLKEYEKESFTYE